jgi:hypothetical protein
MHSIILPKTRVPISSSRRSAFPDLTIVADLRNGAALAAGHPGRLADRDLDPLVPAALRVLDQNVADLAHLATISRLVHRDIQPRTAKSITSADSAALA